MSLAHLFITGDHMPKVSKDALRERYERCMGGAERRASIYRRALRSSYPSLGRRKSNRYTRRKSDNKSLATQRAGPKMLRSIAIKYIVPMVGMFWMRWESKNRKNSTI